MALATGTLQSMIRYQAVNLPLLCGAATLFSARAFRWLLAAWCSCCSKPSSSGRASDTIEGDDSDLRQAAVDEQLAARDVSAVVRGEERHGAGDVIGPADAAERDPVAVAVVQALAVGVGEAAKPRRIDRSRANHVDVERR